MMQRHFREVMFHVLVAAALGVLAWIHETRGISEFPQGLSPEVEAVVKAGQHQDAFQLMVLLWILQGAVLGFWALTRLRGEFDGVSKLAEGVRSLERQLSTDHHLNVFPAVVRAAVRESSVHELMAFHPNELVITDFMLSGLWYREFWAQLEKAQDRLSQRGIGLIVRITQNASAAGATAGPWSGQAGDSLVRIQAGMARKGAQIIRIFVGRPMDSTTEESLEKLRTKMNDFRIHAARYEDDDQTPLGDFLWLTLTGVGDDALGSRDIVVKWLYAGNHVESSRVNVGAPQQVSGLWRQLAAEVAKQQGLSAETRNLLLSTDSFVNLRGAKKKG